ncbi:MAG: type II secretion system protein [Cryobacterium sp.]|nr:type II secretion system protein [Oligoflexia bacterium]
MNSSFNLKSTSGFTLLEVIIVAGLMAALGLGMATMMANQGKAARNVSSIVDRNAFKSMMTGYLQSTENCRAIMGGFGPYNNFTAKPPVGSAPSAYDWKVLGHLNGISTTPGNTERIATSDGELPGRVLKIGQIHLERVGPATAPSGGKITQNTNLHIPMTKVRLGETSVAGSGETNVGGDNFAKEFQIPIAITMDATTFDLTSCSTSEGSCDNNSVLVGGDCRQVTCTPPQVTIGTYVNPVGTHKVGDAICADPNTHYAGTLDGNPFPCPEGEHLDPTTRACTAASVCGTGYFPTTTQTDGSATCCRRVYEEDHGSPDNDYARVSCTAPGESMSNVAGGCQHFTGEFKWLKTYDASGNETGRGNTRTTKAEVRCYNSTGTQVFGDCCRPQKAAKPDLHTQTTCDTANHFVPDPSGSGGCVLGFKSKCPLGFTLRTPASDEMCDKRGRSSQCNTTTNPTWSYLDDGTGLNMGTCSAPADWP